MTLAPGSSIHMSTLLDFGKGLFLLPPSKSSVAFKESKMTEHISERNTVRAGQVFLECSILQSEDKTLHIHVRMTPLHQPSKALVLCHQDCPFLTHAITPTGLINTGATWLWESPEHLNGKMRPYPPTSCVHGPEVLALPESRNQLNFPMTGLC